jgi:hypothetical protein
MSLEFGIEFSCPVRRRISEQQLRELSRIASLNARFVDLSIRTEVPPTKDMMRFMERSGRELSRIEEIMPICRQCPANFVNSFPESEGETIGCLGRINYPIDSRFEHFLANRIQLIVDLLRPEDWPRIMHVLIDTESPFDGEATKELRRVTTAEGLRFFELRIPIKLNRKASCINTDNIFDLFAGFAAADDGVSSYWRELPVMALADYSELFEVIFVTDLSPLEKDLLMTTSHSFRQYLRFAEAVRRADELQVRMLID